MIIATITINSYTEGFQELLQSQISWQSDSLWIQDKPWGGFWDEQDTGSVSRRGRCSRAAQAAQGGEKQSPGAAKEIKDKTGIGVGRAKILLPFAAQLEEPGRDAIGDKKSVWGGRGDNR